MGFLRKLFSLADLTPRNTEALAPKADTPRKGQDRNCVLTSRMVSVSRPYFFGSARLAPNKQWVLGLNDSDGHGHGASRDSGNGTVVLIDYERDKVCWTNVTFARPFDGAVADTGDALVHDAGFGMDLGAVVVALDPSGKERFSRRYTANVFAVEISPCGCFGVVQTAASSTEDSNVLEVLNLSAGRIQFSLHPRTGWADKYSFSTSPDGLEKLWVHLKKLGKFAYSANGDFLDGPKYQKSRLEKGDYSDSLSAARELLESEPSEKNAAIALIAADRALASGAKTQPSWEAVGHRVRGNALELLGNIAEAVEAYDAALRIYPKIGVKRKADSLRKMLDR